MADKFGAYINDFVIRTELFKNALNEMTLYLNELMYGIKDFSFYREELEKDIYNEEKTPSFTFQTITNNLIEVCSTAAFTPVDYSVVNPEQEEPFNTVIISVFPKESKTNVIIGFHNKYKDDWIENHFEEWKSHNEIEFQKNISNLLIKRCETWAISETLFNSLGAEKRRQIINEFENDVTNFSQDLKTEINIFDNKF